jgi:hypothetical protein
MNTEYYRNVIENMKDSKEILNACSTNRDRLGTAYMAIGWLSSNQERLAEISNEALDRVDELQLEQSDEPRDETDLNSFEECCVNWLKKSLFRTPSSGIYDHPTNLDKKVSKIQLGICSDYLCFGYGFDTKKIHRFVPVVENEENDLYSRFIRIPDTNIQYWYQENKYGFDMPCWYQSGHILKFIKAE